MTFTLVNDEPRKRALNLKRLEVHLYFEGAFFVQNQCYSNEFYTWSIGFVLHCFFQSYFTHLAISTKRMFLLQLLRKTVSRTDAISLIWLANFWQEKKEKTVACL